MHRCPACDYELGPLPGVPAEPFGAFTAEVRCPECAFEVPTGARVLSGSTTEVGVQALTGRRRLWQIAIAAQGSMRDALSLTDQAIAHGGGKVAAATVSEMLGYVEREQLRALLDALLAADASGVLAAIDALATQGTDCERVLAEVLIELHRIALVQAVPASLESIHGERDRITAWAEIGRAHV